jgi:predicted CoA-binding protein
LTDVAKLLAATKTIYLVDWPSREVPDTLARSGLTVVSNDGPDEYNAYEVDRGEVRARSVGQPPKRAELVYTHRPIDELPAIVDTARSLGAKAVWIQSGRDESGAKDPHGCWMPPDYSKKAQAIVEASGLTYVEAPYIAEAFRAR